MRLQQTATAVPPYLSRPSSFLKAKADSNSPTLLCLKREDFSLGTRLLLESVQVGKCQRSEIKAEAPVTARPHSGLEGGGNLPRVTDRAQPSWRGSQDASCHPRSSTALHTSQLLKRPHTSASHFGSPVNLHWSRDASENGARGPHTTPSHSGDSPPVYPCPGPLRLKVMVS